MEWLCDETERRWEATVDEKVKVMAEEELDTFGAQSRLNDTFSFETLRLMRLQDFKTFPAINYKDETKNFMYSLLEMKHPGLVARAATERPKIRVTKIKQENILKKKKPPVYATVTTASISS